MTASSTGLKRICLRDFVIVQALDLDIAQGFSVLTGETGAGKSILIDALQLALGSRADASVVREGCVRTEISVEFETGGQITAWLEESGFAIEETILLRRWIDNQGKSRAWINGSPATATQLRALGDQLVDIHGQHAWAALTRPEAVRGLLDAYANVSTKELQQSWQNWRASVQELEKARLLVESNAREQERLNWQIQELEKLAPQQGEWQELNANHTRQAHAQSLSETTEKCIAHLEEDELGALTRVSRSIGLLKSQSHLEAKFLELSSSLDQALDLLEDATHSLHSYARVAQSEPSDFQALDKRMGTWIGMARKYKRNPETLAQLLSDWKSERSALERNADLAALELVQSQSRQAYDLEAKRISLQRTKNAPKLAAAITQAMQGLGMQGGVFEVRLRALDAPSMHGLETVEFLVAGHSGASPKPVAKVASGGELSRLALAIAVTTSRLGTAQTLIFDEVDSGVGGAVAETVGKLMKQLGKDRQVLAVTHLPQVAACADSHLVVTKLRQANATTSDVQAVTGEQRVAEVARMLSGERLSGTTLAHAKELLSQ